MYEQAEEEIHGRMSFIGFMGYPDILPGAKVTGVFRYLLPTAGSDQIIWCELQRQMN